MHELPDADRRRVAIARDSNPAQRLIRQQGAGGNGRHAAVDAVESVRQSQEIRRRFRRAADAGELRHCPRLNPQLIKTFDDALGNRVMAAARAQRGLSAFIAQNLQPQTVYFLGRRRQGGAHFPSCLITSSVTVRASSGSPP